MQDDNIKEDGPLTPFSQTLQKPNPTKINIAISAVISENFAILANAFDNLMSNVNSCYFALYQFYINLVFL